MTRPIESAIPVDRLWALAREETLPLRSSGAVVVADISGFSALTSQLVSLLGPKVGAESLAGYVDPVLEALVAEVHSYAGSVIGFAGDGMTAWFDDHAGLPHGTCPPAAARAVSCAAAMQRQMAR